MCRSNLDYIIFECLAERTIGLAKQEMLKDPTLTLASLRYEYGWTSNDADKMGQCVLAGHGIMLQHLMYRLLIAAQMMK